LSRFDLLIKNGTILDGSGLDRFNGDIGVSEGKIVEMGDLAGEDGDAVIDATGRSLIPIGPFSSILQVTAR